MRFWKLQSIGNDFPLIHLDDLKEREGGPSLEFQLAELAAKLSDRRFGIGGDGLLAVRMEPSSARLNDGVDGNSQDPSIDMQQVPASPAGGGSILRLRMFNPDGTEDFCGNGIRCAALHAHHLGWVGKSFTVRHLDEEVPTEILDGGTILTTLPPASYDPPRIPLIGRRIFNETVWAGMDSGMPLSLFGSALTTGSTHVVIPTVELPDDDTFLAVSPKIENDPQFPARTSVIWCKEIGPMHLKIRIWERGAGETLGCGTGSSAAAIDYLRRKNTGGIVAVENPGGTVRITAESWESPILVEGTASEVFVGSWRD